jgi:hypothetical protein
MNAATSSGTITICAQQVELLDDRRLIGQLLGLERRVGRLRDVVDHPPGGHDDVALAAAGALVAAWSAGQPITAEHFKINLSLTKPNDFAM